MEGVEIFIIQELSQYRDYSREIAKAMDELWDNDDVRYEKRVMILEWRLSAMDCWLSALNVRESFVLTQHFVDGQPWTQTAYEYKKVFGGAEADESDMCRIQTQAVEKIRRLISEDFLDDPWFSCLL